MLIAETSGDVQGEGFTCPGLDENQLNTGVGSINPHPTYEDPNDCARFYICLNGVVPRAQQCERGLVYNSISRECDSVENVPEW